MIVMLTLPPTRAGRTFALSIMPNMGSLLSPGTSLKFRIVALPTIVGTSLMGTERVRETFP